MRHLIAAARFPGFKLGPAYYWGLGILAVLMVVALVKAYQMWEELHDVEEPDSPADLLESFEEAHSAGELDDEEFERVRRRLARSATGQDEKSAPPERDAGNPDGL